MDISRRRERSARVYEFQDYNAQDINVVLWAHAQQEWGGFKEGSSHQLAEHAISIFGAVEPGQTVAPQILSGVFGTAESFDAELPQGIEGYFPIFNVQERKWHLHKVGPGMPLVPVGGAFGSSPLEDNDVRGFTGVAVVEHLRLGKLGLGPVVESDDCIDSPVIETWRNLHVAIVKRAACFVKDSHKRILENFLSRHAVKLRKSYENSNTQKNIQYGYLWIQSRRLKGQTLPVMTLGPKQLKKNRSDENAKKNLKKLLKNLSEYTVNTNRSNLQSVEVTADFSVLGIKFHDIANALTRYQGELVSNHNITSLIMHHQVVSLSGRFERSWMQGWRYLSTLLAQLPNLRVLDLQHNKHMTSTQLWPGLRTCVHLESLTLDVCPPLFELTALAEAKQTKGTQRLNKLSLQGNFSELFTARGLLALEQLLGHGCAVSFTGNPSELKGVIASALMGLLYRAQAKSVYLAHHPGLFTPEANNGAGTAMRALHDGLKQNWLLQDLHLEDVGLNNVNIAPLRYALEMNHSLQSLHLKFSRMSCVTALSILRIARHHLQLQSISLGCLTEKESLSELLEMAKSIMEMKPRRIINLDTAPFIDVDNVNSDIEKANRRYKTTLLKVVSDNQAWYRQYAKDYLVESLSLLHEMGCGPSGDAQHALLANAGKVALYGTIAIASIGLTVAAGPITSHALHLAAPFLVNVTHHMGMTLGQAQVSNLVDYTKALLKGGGGAVERTALNQAATATADIFNCLYARYWKGLSSPPFFIAEQAERETFVCDLVVLLNGRLSQMSTAHELKTFCDEVLQKLSAAVRQYSEKTHAREELTAHAFLFSFMSSMTGMTYTRDELRERREELGEDKKSPMSGTSSLAGGAVNELIHMSPHQAALDRVMMLVTEHFDRLMQIDNVQSQWPGVAIELVDDMWYMGLRQAALELVRDGVQNQISVWKNVECEKVEKHQALAAEVTTLWHEVLTEAEGVLTQRYQGSGADDTSAHSGVGCTSQPAEIEAGTHKKCRVMHIFRRHCQRWVDNGTSLPVPVGAPINVLDNILDSLVQTGHIALLRIVLGNEMYRVLHGGEQVTYIEEGKVCSNPYIVWEQQVQREARLRLSQHILSEGGGADCEDILASKESSPYQTLISRLATRVAPDEDTEYAEDIVSSYGQVSEDTLRAIVLGIPWLHVNKKMPHLLVHLLCGSDFLSRQFKKTFECALKCKRNDKKWSKGSKRKDGRACDQTNTDRKRHDKARWKVANTTILTRLQQGQLDCLSYLVKAAVHLIRSGPEDLRRAISSRLEHALLALSKAVADLEDTTAQQRELEDFRQAYDNRHTCAGDVLPNFEWVHDWVSRYFERQRAGYFVDTLLSAIASMVPSEKVSALSERDLQYRVEAVSRWIAVREQEACPAQEPHSSSVYYGSFFHHVLLKPCVKNVAAPGKREYYRQALLKLLPQQIQLRHLLALCQNTLLFPVLHLYFQSQKISTERCPLFCKVVLKQSPENYRFQNLLVRLQECDAMSDTRFFGGILKDEIVNRTFLGSLLKDEIVNRPYDEAFDGPCSFWSRADECGLRVGNRAIAREASRFRPIAVSSGSDDQGALEPRDENKVGDSVSAVHTRAI